MINRIPYPINEQDIFLIYPDNGVTLNFVVSLSDLIYQVDVHIRDVIFQSVVKDTIRRYELGESIYEICFAIQHITYKMKMLRDSLDKLQYALMDSEN